MEDETDLEPASLNAASLDRMLGLYRGQAAACRTENQLNRLHIALDNYLTPTEVRHLN